jgi:glycosyltransferase 2 family protein
MSPGHKRLMIALKSLLAVLLISFVGWKFAGLLRSPELLHHTTIRPVPLILAGLLYLGCHTLWGTFWWQLLRGQGVRASWYASLRAYFVSQVGKYVPGKAWVLLLRVGLLRSSEARPAVVIVTGLYETLTNMAAGALLGVALLPWSGLSNQLSAWQRYGLFSLALMPLALLGLNRLVRRIAIKYRRSDAPPIPVPSLGLLAVGLVQAMLGWALLGLSLWLTSCGLSIDPPELTGESYLQYLSWVCIAYVIGFVILVSPAGVGAREYVLQTVLARQLLAADGTSAEALAAAIALGVRVVWTLFEILAMLGLWLLPPKSAQLPSSTHAE